MLLHEDLEDEDILHRTRMSSMIKQVFEVWRAALHKELSIRIHLALTD